MNERDLRGLTRKFHRHARVTQKHKQIRFGHQLFSLCSKIWDRKEMLTCLPRRARTRHAGALRILLHVKCSACRVKKRTSEPQRCLPPVHRNRTTVAIYNSERPGLYVPFGTDVPLVRRVGWFSTYLQLHQSLRMMLWPFRGASLLLPFVAVKTLCVFVAALLYDLVFWVDAPVCTIDESRAALSLQLCPISW